ncbi:MAG: thioesterase [Candidatus Fluviicola riflensis]|nr:MAG: thioesterase [Candidatus Fluviicola riflensis]OGS79235.1 MAG: thioesterase [Candidatus Fluviicola riflensis]OGS86667.1 MAG: thioesterase [Fluviicola sp. RIFCSPHIGHO2_01_FULL_43_53]OGS88859.1 MAG: thioesterase [Fluviicola sp. RIFCSPHIGHO2_12_FULL_43_24]
MKSSFNHTIRLRVRYGETDQMGYCYYGNYASYFEVGRVEALRSLGMSYRSLEENGIMLPVSHFEVDYLSPALYDDELTVKTSIVLLKGARLFFEYTIHNEAEKLVATAKTTLVFVSKTNMKPITPPKEFIDLISNYHDGE